MIWFTNLSTRAKLLLGFGAMWVFLAAVGVMAYRDIAGIAASEKEMQEVSLVKVILLQELRADMHYSRGQALELILTPQGPERDAIVKNLDARAGQVQKGLERLFKLELDPRNLGALKEVESTLADYHKTRGKLITLVNEGKAEEAAKLVIGDQDSRYEKIRSLTVNLAQKEQEVLAKRIDTDLRQAQNSTVLFAVLGGAAFFLGLAMIALLNHTVARPLGELSSVAARIAAGDLTVESGERERRDEVGVLNQTFYEMVRNLRKSTSEISEAINQLGAAGSEIMTATTQVAAGTAETAAAINETTSTVEQVRQAVQLSRQKAEDVSDNAQSVAEVANSGSRAAEDVALAMERIKQEMESIAKTIIFLSEQGQSIGGIIASVTDLADQSNLLAVNAAIEAAKAGEQGKGFAVVAQEIKNLAEQSKQATNQVRTILNDIQKATGAAVMATEQGSKAVEGGIRQFAQAGEAIRALAASTTEAAQAATQITVSSQQQVVGMDQVGDAMESINQAGTDTASTMKQVEVAAQNLNELGQNLKRLIARYTL